MPPDPTICSFKAQSVSVDWSNPGKLDVAKDHELQAVSRENNIELFSNGSGLNDFDTTGLYVIKDKSEVAFMNSITTQQNKFLRVAVLPCQQDKLPEGESCADEATAAQFYQKYEL